MPTLARSFVALACVLALGGLAGCSTDTNGGGGGTDGGGVDDTGSGDDTGSMDLDAGDPLNAAPTCTSGTNWLLGDRGSPLMHPGMACITCHSTRRAPFLSIGGTVFPTGHEPDNCYGVDGLSGDEIDIVVTDSTGQVITMAANTSGNFYSQAALTPPLTAEVRYQGRVRAMTTPADTGDCNSCHTQDGTMSAPGRIVLP
jgi:hypothetical protein